MTSVSEPDHRGVSWGHTPSDSFILSHCTLNSIWNAVKERPITVDVNRLTDRKRTTDLGVETMRIRVEGFNPVYLEPNKNILHSDYDQHHVFDDLQYGPIHEQGDMSNEEMIKEFLQKYPQFNESDCRIIKVGEERNIHGKD